MDNWSIYVVECSDSSLYTGISNNVEKRILAHNAKKGAASLKGKLPVKLVYQEFLGSKSLALKREYAIKKLTRKEKLKLINQNYPILRSP
jgi:putative endonuclease